MVAHSLRNSAPHRDAADLAENEGRKVADRYLLTRQLGTGGMGRVWLAWDELLQRNVAVKEVLPRHAADDDADLGRTLREARAAATLDHPGIITVYDVVDHDGRPWIIMKVIDGPSLADHLRDEGPLPVHTAAEIGIRVIEALDAAHQHGVLHRDVKPSNIMLDRGQVVLTDFGIATIDGATVLTVTGQLVGAPEYIAPERIAGQEASRAADLWAVGITLYNIVIGDTPFRRTDTLATFGAIATEQPNPHPGLGPLWPVIQGLLEKKPADRLTAAAALAQLRELAGQPAAQPLSLPRPSKHLAHTEPQPTVLEPTALRTRHEAPPLLPSGDETVRIAKRRETPLRPGPSRTSWSRPRIAACVGVVALAVAVVVPVVLLNRPPDSGRASPGTSVQALPAVFTEDREPLGFSINVPRGYVRQASAVSTVSDVVWQAAQPDPGVGTLLVQVRRDDTQPDVQPIDYLGARERAERADSDDVTYRRLSLIGQGDGPAVWEYTHGAAVTGDHFHVRTLAMASGGHLYLLTFSLYARDVPTLQAQWRAAEPVMDVIWRSFHLTS